MPPERYAETRPVRSPPSHQFVSQFRAPGFLNAKWPLGWKGSTKPRCHVASGKRSFASGHQGGLAERDGEPERDAINAKFSVDSPIESDRYVWHEISEYFQKR